MEMLYMSYRILCKLHINYAYRIADYKWEKLCLISWYNSLISCREYDLENMSRIELKQVVTK